MDVNKTEIEREIILYKKKIVALQREISEKRKTIEKCDSAYVEICKKISETEARFQNELQKINKLAKKLPSGTNFGEEYYDHFRSIVFGKNANNAISDLNGTKENLKNKSYDLEDEIQHLLDKIQYYNDRIEELKQKILSIKEN